MNTKLLRNVLDVASRLILTVSLLLVLAPPALAQETLPNQGVFSPSVWAPQTAKWENGLPRGYSETESAAFAVELKSGLAADSYVMELSLQASQAGSPVRYGFSGTTAWDVSFQPPTLPGGPAVDYSYASPLWDRDDPIVWGYNLSVDSVTAPAWRQESNGDWYLVTTVVFTTNGGQGFIVYGGRFAAPGDVLPAGVPAGLNAVVPWGQGASTISGNFQARWGSGGDKTINFKGSGTAPAVPSIAIDKVGSVTTAEIGETVTYTITVTNDGELPLSNVVVSDPLLGLSDYVPMGSAGAGILLVGESVQIVGSYTVTAADYNSRNPLVNTATADSNWAGPVSDTWSVTITAAPGLSILKTGDAGPVSIGDTIDYAITVYNTGNIGLTNVSVVDAKLGINTNLGALAVGASQTITGTYGPVSESDLPGPIVNTATADSDQTGPVTDTHSVGIVTDPSLSIVKTGDDTVYVGDTIQYTITVTNDGDVTLTNVTITDPLLGLNQNVGTLAPGASTSVYPTYGPVTMDDYEGDNPLPNTASATSDQAGPVSDNHSVIIITRPVQPQPGLAIVKTGDVGPVGIGGYVNYQITVSNTGNITLTNVTVVDAKLGINTNLGSLGVGASQTITGTYGPVGESDLPGPIVNTATADSDQTDSVQDSHTVSIVKFPALGIVKTGDAGPVGIGDYINYQITVSNDGDITLTNVTLVDAKLGINMNLGTLGVGASQTITGTYGPVSESDLPGPIVNTATADSDQTDSVQDSHTVSIVKFPALGIVKTGDAGPVGIGDYVSYQITVSNDGDITLTNVTLVDAKLGINMNLGTLGVGASQTITGTYGPVSESDLPGPIVNTATADSDQTGSVQDSHTVSIVATPGLNIVKTGVPVVKVGESAAYTITVSNTGDVILYGVWLEDAMLGIDQSVGNLAPGESTTVYGSYGPVTQWEYENTNPLVNTAIAWAPEQAGPVQDTHRVIIISEPEQPPTPVPPCVRTDVSVIIYGAWGNTPVKAWVGGTEQTTLYTAANSQGEQQVMWTFYPPESGTWTVNVAAELPAGANGDEWSYKLIRVESPTEGWTNDSPAAASVNISRCQQYVIYLQLVHESPEVPEPPALPQTGGAAVPAGLMSREAVFALLGLNLISGAYLILRKKQH
ncbi:MAG: DUF7507 domain-containing protein [Anaerolineae bacterium]|jgi:uncharacterized repeat protein (TIGR01451 family)